MREISGKKGISPLKSPPNQYAVWDTKHKDTQDSTNSWASLRLAEIDIALCRGKPVLKLNNKGSQTLGLWFSPIIYILKMKIQGVDKKTDISFHVLLV